MLFIVGAVPQLVSLQLEYLAIYFGRHLLFYHEGFGRTFSN